MKILHCVYDEKFLDGAIRTYNNDTRHINKYIAVSNEKKRKPFKYIKYEDVEILTEEAFLVKAHDYDVVILHSLNCLPLNLVSMIPACCKVVWYAWGFDFYCGSNAPVKVKLYHKKTHDYLALKLFYYKFKMYLLYFKELKARKALRNALNRIDYFSGVFPYEYDLLKRERPYIHAKPLDFYYGDVDFFVKNEVDPVIDRHRTNILIGNSGDPSNNHIDALLQLKSVSLPKDTRIIIPMNYGPNKDYIKWVSGQAQLLYPHNVFVLDRFLPLNEYLQLVSKCKAAIFFHERQQASDNIFMQLLYGAKVYMSETSKAYLYLKELGFKVFSLQKEAESIMEDFSDEDILHNRQLLARYYSAKTITERIEIINNTISSAINGVS